MKKILGLDLGTNSIGWALIEKRIEIKEDKIMELNEGSIIDLGSRIIPMSQDVLGDFDKGVTKSQTAERTRYRGVRRLRERHLLRRERLHRVLNILDFLPKHYAQQIDFEKRPGQFISETEPKLVYSESNAFIFKKSFGEMLAEFALHQPELVEGGKKVPYDWTIYYLRKKALTEKVEKEELAWLLLNFNQKRGYYQLRGEDEEESQTKLIEFHSLRVVEVTADERQKGKDEIWYNIILENGWVYRRAGKLPLFDWKDKTKDFVVTTDLNNDGTVKKDKDNKEKRSFRSPDENDWTLVKTKTEQTIGKSGKTVGQYIYDTLLKNPSQKINGKLVRVIERKFYKDELRQILETQQKYHPELQDKNVYNASIEDLYENNEAHRNNIANRNFVHLFLDDIIFYQRPLKSKKSLISDCKFESRAYVLNGEKKTEALKCIAKSHPLFQEFRLWKWMQDFRLFDRETDSEVTDSFLQNEDDKVKFFEFLNDRKEIDQKAILKHFKLKEKTHRWNFVEDKSYPCNETRSQILNRLAKCENVPDDFLTKEKEEALWHILYSVNDKLEIPKALETFAAKNQLDSGFVEQFKKFPPYKNEYGNYSSKAVKKLLPLMRMGKYWSEETIHEQTKERIGKIINGEYDEKIQDRVREKAINLKEIDCFKGLPEWLAKYIVYDRHSEEGDLIKWKTAKDLENYLNPKMEGSFKQHSLRNPIVEQVITETLRVVKDIWIKYGNGIENYFDEIHIELGREMKNPADKRKSMAEKNTENENTNLRIKALLIEMMNDKNVENVRPYSPSQQEILKIYEDGVLNSSIEVPDDILKISKTSQPSKNDLVRYKLWLEQKYRSPYTGEMIPLNKLFTPAYEIEHIIPQSRYFDDSFGNKVICESEVNKHKDNRTAFEYIQDKKGSKIELSGGRFATLFTELQYEEFVKINYAKSFGKMKKLLMLEIPEKMIERQMNDTRYISKEVKNLLSKIVREEKRDDGTTSKNVLSSNGQITAKLKNDWGLNDIWNEIITPRFERMNAITGNEGKFGELNKNTGKFLPTVPLELQKGFNKKRIDHRHHAMDALVVACATRNHINYLNNQNALEKGKNNEQKQESRDDLKRLLCNKTKPDFNGNYKWIFKKPWDSYTKDAKDILETTIISFKQNLRVINKTVNKYQKWGTKNGTLEKMIVTQTKGESWAIRRPMHAETVSGKVQLQRVKENPVSIVSVLEHINLVVDKEVKAKLHVLSKNFSNDLVSFKKHLKVNPIKVNDKIIDKILVYETIEASATRKTLDSTFDEDKIRKITDTGIQKILFSHLKQSIYQNAVDEKGKKIPAQELAFSEEGLDKLNQNIKILNNGKLHQPIKKVRVFEEGSKFSLGIKGNKKDKYVEAAKGTNLFFAIYKNNVGKRNYASIPFNEVVESQKQSAALKEKPRSVPLKNSNGDDLLFHLSPNDLVYVPTEQERGNSNIINFEKLNREQQNRVLKFVSCTGSEGHFVPNCYSSPIIKNEIGANNKSQINFNSIQIKSVCWKLQIDRLGKIKKIIR
ncbi:type II CRISPR RNA-guided endonuclease Cas9 [soil metagenome]